MKTIFGSECNKDVFTVNNKAKGVTILARHMLSIHITEAKWHVKDTPSSYLTSAAFFSKVLLQTPRNIHIPINMYDALSRLSEWLISRKSVLITEGLLTNISKNCDTFPSWPK